MVYVLLANGFEETEALVPIDILRRCGIEVKIAAIADKVVEGAHGITVYADITAEEIKEEDMSCLILPGGAGYVNIEGSKRAMSLISYAEENEILLCAICAAPSILGKLGYLKGKHATCFPGFEEELTGAIISGQKAVQDGRIITGRGAGAAAEFGFLIAENLAGVKKACEIRSTMQF